MTITTRADIQAMRGIAVLAVLAYHARMPFIKGGYLGVDIFFVVSGYLITGLIARAMSDGRFSLAAFYWRRAWRLLPAAYAVFLACVLVSPWLLTVAEQRDFFKQLLGALTFTGNIALWLQTGYFEQAAELKPLLHVWSLAIEEQYYLLLPAAMALVGPRRWRAAALFATLASAAACFALVASKPGDAFYLLPTRAWELGVGSAAALWVAQPVNLAVPSARWEWLGTLCLVVLAVLVVTPLQAAHPGWTTALACGLTGVVLAAGLRWLGARYGSSALAWFGDRSYSLYLIHWPIFAFLNSANISGGGLPWWVRLLAMLASIVLAALLFRYVETPLRLIGHQEVRWPRATWLVVATSSLAVIGVFAIPASGGAGDYSARLRPNPGLDAVCDQVRRFEHRDRCSVTGSTRPIAVWGDSFAMHWVPGLAASGASVIQATKPTCAPIAAFALLSPPQQPRAWAEDCLAFNADVLTFLKAESAKVDSVALASPWSYLFGRAALSTDGTVVVLDRAALQSALVKQILEIQALGVRVVLIVPTPTAPFEVGRCVERRDRRLFTFGATADCAFSYRESTARGQPVVDFLHEIGAKTNVPVLDPAAKICSSALGQCRAEEAGLIIYRDTGHLTYEGSVALAKRSNLVAQILKR